MLCKIFDMDKTDDYKYVVIFSLYRGKLLLSRHKARDTWETQGGHVEPGETTEQAARRELWEESGAKEFTIRPVCGYWAANDEKDPGANGAIYLAEITELGPIPESEMAEVRLFEDLPENVTYPWITGPLWRHLQEKHFPSRLDAGSGGML